MAQSPDDERPFTGFGLSERTAPDTEAGVFILAVYRDGMLTAAAHATERGAMLAAIEYLDRESDENDEGGTLEDRFARAQESVAEEGGLMDILPSPVYDD